ncbi:hypothetical protein BGX34_008245 [Mortierella sp. NVP85]|nr:hypothetical protein BGX34_008245 [Mortierella sp. NVP85]
MTRKKKSSKKHTSQGTASLPLQQGKSITPPSKAPAKATLTRFAIPEILSRIISFLELKDIFSACQVSCLFHSVCAPELWRVIHFDGYEADNIWHGHEGFRMGLVRYGLFVEELCLMRTSIKAKDMKLIAENCTRLRVLDLTGTRVQAEALKVLIHGDPYDTLPGSAEKSKQQTHVGGKVGKKEGGDGKDIDDVDMEGKMREYRKMAAAANGGNSGTYYSSAVGSVPSPLVKPSSVSSSRRMHSAKVREILKASRRQFPYFLEELILNKCPDLLGTKCLPIISRLGPQLIHLALDRVRGVVDEDMLHVWRHCTNLRGLSLKETEITDILLAAMTESLTSSSGSRLPLIHLNVVDTDISDNCLESVIRASRDTLTSLATCSIQLYATDSEILYALIEGPRKVGIQGGQSDLVQAISEMKLEGQAIYGPTKRTFTTNTVLTSINLSVIAGGFFDDVFEELFLYATELSTIRLESCEFHDGALLILAENYRKRMERQGLGVPKAWHKHEKSMQKEQGKDQSLHTPRPKFYAGGKVVGGLKVLWLKDCSELGNFGVRAIVRSCVGLERLGLSGDSRVSLRIFRGPWACLDLVELDISEVNVGFRDPGGMVEMNEEVGEDEYAEARRFPIAPVKDFNTRLDFDSDGNYDYISKPSSEDDDDDYWRNEDEWELDGKIEDVDDDYGNDDDDDDDATEIYGDDGKPMNLKYPPLGRRNQTAHRTTLQEFYKRLGQLKHLRKLNMSNSDYRIRIHDGLHFVLPGLRNSLEEWNITRYPEYRFHNHELAWIGKQFGYGISFPDYEEGPGYQSKMVAKLNADGNPDKHRIGKLQSLTVSDYTIGCLTTDVSEWFEDQGIALCYQDEDDNDTDNE